MDNTKQNTRELESIKVLETYQELIKNSSYFEIVGHSKTIEFNQSGFLEIKWSALGIW